MNREEYLSIGTQCREAKISGLLITVAVDRDFDQVLIKSNRGVDGVSMECCSRALINTQFVLFLSGYKESWFSQRGKLSLEFTGQMVISLA